MLFVFSLVVIVSDVLALVAVPSCLLLLFLSLIQSVRHISNHVCFFQTFAVLGILLSVSYALVKPVMLVRSGYNYIICLGNNFDRLMTAHLLILFKFFHSFTIYLVLIGYCIHFAVRYKWVEMRPVLLWIGLILDGFIAGTSTYFHWSGFKWSMASIHSLKQHDVIVADTVQTDQVPVYFVASADSMQSRYNTRFLLQFFVLIACAFMEILGVFLRKDKLMFGRFSNREDYLRNVRRNLKFGGMLILSVIHLPYLAVMFMAIRGIDLGFYAVPIFLGSALLPPALSIAFIGKVGPFTERLPGCVRRDGCEQSLSNPPNTTTTSGENTTPVTPTNN